jgi:hypothetical protein
LPISVEDLVFDEESHTTTAPDGTDVPHVTSVLHETRVATDFEELSELGGRVAENIELAKARGTAVHMDCHALDDDDLDWASVDPRVAPYVEAWKVFKENHKLRPIAGGRERRIYHPVLNYTGILDGVFGGNHGNILIDIKTGNPEASAAHIQTSAYVEPWEMLHPDIPIHQRWAVWLKPKLAVPYRCINYTNPNRHEQYQDMNIFRACLAVYRAQPGRRKKVS